MINWEWSALGTTHSSTHASLLLLFDSSLKRRFIPFSLQINFVSNPCVFFAMVVNRRSRQTTKH